MSHLIRFAAAAAMLAAMALVAPVEAASPRPYSPAALQAAQAAGKPVVVHVTAAWCSTCAAQMPVVMQILKEPKFKDLVLLNVDFDTQKSLLRKLDVRAQSTFVAFKGKAEVGRSTGVTDKAAIEHLFGKAS